MTFSQSVKNEILKSLRGVKTCCASAFLNAALKAIGFLSIERKKYYFSLESDNHEFLSLCCNMASNAFSVDGKIQSYNVNAKGAAVYSCSFDGNLGEKLGLTLRGDGGSLELTRDTQYIIPQNECCKRVFMQSLFVSCGSVVIPVADTDVGENTLRAKYHLELRFTDEDFAKAVLDGYSQFQFKITSRKNYFVLYLKDSERIADFLVYLNAMSAKLKLENVIIGRSMRNDANRQSNCISANIEKSVVAAEKQLNAITELKRNGVYYNLSLPLKQIAEIRENNPEASLDEIAAILNISKSGANHRFAKLIELAFK